MRKVESWTPEEGREALDSGRIVLIDVRTPAEYMFEHIDGALLMPMAFFEPKGMPDQVEKRIVLHCGSGSRSEQIALELLMQGFDRIAHMDGGIGAWKETGLPYHGTDMNTGAPKLMNAV